MKFVTANLNSPFAPNAQFLFLLKTFREKKKGTLGKIWLYENIPKMF